VCCCVLCECVCVYLCILWCVDGLVVSCVVRTAGYVFGGTYPQWGRIAQSVERSANNAVVLGSSPSMTISLRIYAFIDSYVLTLAHPCFLYTLHHRSTTISEVRSLPCTLYEVLKIANNIWYFWRYTVLYRTSPHRILSPYPTSNSTIHNKEIDFSCCNWVDVIRVNLPHSLQTSIVRMITKQTNTQTPIKPQPIAMIQHNVAGWVRVHGISQSL